MPTNLDAVEFGEGENAIVYMHGLGGHGVGAGRFANLYPKNTKVYGVNAPISMSSQGKHRAWYFQIDDDIVEVDLIKASMDLLKDFILDLKEKHNHILLTGFSQGGSMSLTFPVYHPGVVENIAAFSGYLVKDESIQISPEAVENTNYLIVHGKSDFENPYYLAERAYDRLAEHDAKLDFFSHIGGHTVPRNMMHRALVWWQSKINSELGTEELEVKNELV